MTIFLTIIILSGSPQMITSEIDSWRSCQDQRWTLQALDPRVIADCHVEQEV